MKDLQIGLSGVKGIMNRHLLLRLGALFVCAAFSNGCSQAKFDKASTPQSSTSSGSDPSGTNGASGTINTTGSGQGTVHTMGGNTGATGRLGASGGGSGSSGTLGAAGATGSSGSLPTAGTGASSNLPTGGSGSTGALPTGGSGSTGALPTGGSGSTGALPTGGSGSTGTLPTGGSGSTGTLPTGGSTASGNLPTSSLPQPTATASCVAKVNHVLIIDLKSGWWDGDGAGTFNAIAKSLNSTCSMVTLEYAHNTVSGITGDSFMTSAFSTFPSQPYSYYDEIWILSGDPVDDSDDLPLNSARFQAILNGVMSSNANLMIGAGDASNRHANAVTNALGLGTAFQTAPGSGYVLFSTFGGGLDFIQVLSQINGPFSGPLFQNVVSLPDSLRVNFQTSVSDILIANSGITPVLSSSTITEVGTATVGTRKIVLEANLGRFYGVLTSDQNVRNYLVNIMSYLQH